MLAWFFLQAGSNGHYSQILSEGDGGVRSLCGVESVILARAVSPPEGEGGAVHLFSVCLHRTSVPKHPHFISFFFFWLACSIFSIHGTRLWFRTLSDLSFPLNFKSALIVPLHHFNRNVQCIKGYFRGVWVCACVCRLARAVRRGYRHIVSTSIWVTYLIIRDLSIHPLIISYWTDSSMETL